MIQIVKWLVSLILISQLPYKLVKQTLLTNILIWPNISINQSNKLKVRSFDMWNTLVFLDKIFLDDIYKKLVVLKKWKEKKKYILLICWVVNGIITINVIMSRNVKDIGVGHIGTSSFDNEWIIFVWNSSYIDVT